MATIFTILIFSCLFCSGWSQENDSDDLPSYQARSNFRDRTCFQSTKEKNSFFVNPANFENQCSLIVTPYSEKVCQIRLDFEQFSIAQPTQLTSASIDGSGSAIPGSSWQCNIDEFRVGTLFGTMNLGFQHLCGENEGQHIYIPITQTTGAISLNFALSHRTSKENIPPKVPRWRIKITQLECLSAADSALIAPPGCLQYYPQRTGSYESFNYNYGGRYIGQMSYAVCFKRTPDICGIRHTSVTFGMNFAGVARPPAGTPTSDNTICIATALGNPTIDVVAGSEDYILIPGGRYNIPTTVTNVPRDNFCGTMLPPGAVVTSSAPGPLYVGVSHDARNPSIATSGVEWGFRFNYQLLNVGCQTFFNRFIPINEMEDEE